MKRAALAVNKKSRRWQNGGKRFGFLSAFHLSLRDANGRRNSQPLPPVLGRIRLAGAGDVHVRRERKTCNCWMEHPALGINRGFYPVQLDTIREG
jgi:hypothetical protein